MADDIRIGGVYEVAETLGCAKQQIASLRRRSNFPQPVVLLAATPVWDLDEIEEFKQTWVRHGQRKEKTVPEAIAVETVSA
jgi:predicted DNA-binding transcriptional regulator AlpA